MRSGRRLSVHAGDALAVLQRMEPDSVDAVITDPPYSSGGAFRGDRAGMATSAKYVQTGTETVRPEFAGDNRDQRSFGYWCTLWLSECLRVARVGSPICLFTDWRQLPMVTDVLQAGGWVWRGVAVWDKGEGWRERIEAERPQESLLEREPEVLAGELFADVDDEERRAA